MNTKAKQGKEHLFTDYVRVHRVVTDGDEQTGQGKERLSLFVFMFIICNHRRRLADRSGQRTLLTVLMFIMRISYGHAPLWLTGLKAPTNKYGHEHRQTDRLSRTKNTWFILRPSH